MLNLINRYAYGFVAVPVILACREQGLFELLKRHEPLTEESIRQSLNANNGPLRVALRLLHSLKWLEYGDCGYTLTAAADEWRHIPEGLVELYRFPVGSPRILIDASQSIVSWIALSLQGWQLEEKRTADLLDGTLLLPVLFALRAQGMLEEGVHPLLAQLQSPLRAALIELFRAKDWVSPQEDGAGHWTEMGRHLADRLLILGVTISYTTLLSHLPELLFGDPRVPFNNPKQGPETHLDRSLNVIASGFQHEKFFHDLDDAIQVIFDSSPLEQQPAYVADMGCGDGTLLCRIYRHIRTNTARGRVLDRYPLSMIGIDISREALQVAATTLSSAGVPHTLLLGDVADPERLERDLRKQGIVDCENILHIRTFLDHDRPYQNPLQQDHLASRRAIPYDGVFVAEDGGAIAPADAIQGLYEHLHRWARLSSRHGLLILEVHCLDAVSVGRYLDLSENLHFDALHGFSKQQLVEAADFLLTAAETGLFAKPGFQQRYPRTLPFCRITLNWFETRPYRLRLANQKDLPALLDLEASCWPEPLRGTEAMLRQRLKQFPKGQCLLKLEGRIVAAIYSQRIETVVELSGTTFAEALTRHRPDGAVLQLIAVNVQPEVQHLGLGDQLLEFMLQYAALMVGVEWVAGVTRCLHFRGAGATEMEDYIRQLNNRGQPLDPVLSFHAHHGATIAQVLPGYRPEDRDNHGCGVLVTYDLKNRRPGAPPAPPGHPHQSQHRSLATTVAENTRMVLGKRRSSSFSMTATFKDMGLDSLDLLELRAAINHAAGIQLEPVFFFRQTTPQAVANYLEAMHDEGQTASLSHPAEYAIHPAPAIAGAPADDEARPAQEAEADCCSIAIVGMGCRFPGGADHVDSYWELLVEGRDAIGSPPPGRGNGELDEARFPARHDLPALRLGGFLHDADRFDAAFFGIAPREAHRMDPQQRLLMEVAWQALEHAGIDPRLLEGSDTGVFVGLFGHDYELLHYGSAPEADLDAYFSTGAAPSVASGRLSYFLGLKGPALTVDTACSSSLAALHLACRSLRDGECNLALAAGVNLILTPTLSIAFARAGMLSPDGRCRTFDAQANGYVRGEGCGVVVLKPLASALADGDTIYAVVRGSALNQDGRSNGLTAPNGQAQEEVIHQALTAARIEPAQVRYVEAHGTGTPLGDPVEVQALQAVYGKDRDSDFPLVIGSVKTNIGHLEAAAGMAGLIKTALSLHHGQIPRHLHFKEANPHLDLDRVVTVVPTVTLPWPRESGQPRLAGVSSFGFSGTNAHVILEESPVNTAMAPAATDCGPLLLTLSATSEASLGKLALQLSVDLQSRPLSLSSICYTANARRTRFDHRLAITIPDADPALLAARLVEFAGRKPSTKRNGAASEPPKLAMLFTGQGSQYPEMGRELYLNQPVFRRVLEECDALLRKHSPIHLIDLLYGKISKQRLNQTLYTQPALFAFEFALASLWASWGIHPDAVLGHSVGEYVAACLANVFTLEDGLRLIAARARLMQELPMAGGMASVRAPWQTVLPVLTGLEQALEIAAFNGPEETVISGPCQAVTAAMAAFAGRGIRCIGLQTSHAFHSRLIEPMLEPFRLVLNDIHFSPPELDYLSNLTGQLAGAEVTDPGYWVEHARQPVRFAQGVTALETLGYRHFLEVGPRPLLTMLGRKAAAKDSHWLTSLTPGVRDQGCLFTALGELFVAGAHIDWAGFYRLAKIPLAVLPPYPFQRRRYWLPATATTSSSPLSPREPTCNGESSSVKCHTPTTIATHPLLGPRLSLSSAAAVFECTLGPTGPEYLRRHRLRETPVLAAAALLEMVLASAYQLKGVAKTGFTITGLCFEQVLELTADATPRIQLLLMPDHPEGAWHFRLLSSGAPEGPEQTWTLHAHGRLTDRAHLAVPAVDVALLRDRLREEVSIAAFQTECRQHGLELDADAMQHLWRGRNESLCHISLPEETGDWTGYYHCHPLLLDAALFSALATFDHGLQVLHKIKEFHWLAPLPHNLWCHCRRLEQHGESPQRELILCDEQGRVVAYATGCQFAPFTSSPHTKKHLDDAITPPVWQNWLYQIQWRPVGHGHHLGLNSPEELMATLGPLAVELGGGENTIAVAGLPEELERLSLLYLATALQALGLTMQGGESCQVEELIPRLGVAASFSRLFKHLLATLQEEGFVHLHGSLLSVVRTLPTDDPVLLRDRLLARYPSAIEEINLLAGCGSRLAEVLRGACPPLSLLFPETDPSLLTRLYQNGPAFTPMHTLVVRALDRVLESLPPGHGPRILEIGAGTGGTSAWILPRLPAEGSEYLFTDISSHFFNAARQRFAAYPFVHYRRLDIDQAPESQDFKGQHYDLIVASNVLHATRDLATTLDHVRSLLVPGGLLFLVEGTTPRRWIDLIFGLLEGWWRFSDTALRPAYPLLPPARWQELLRNQGFTSVTATSPLPTEAMLFPQSLILAQNSLDPVVINSTSAPDRLIFVDAQGIGNRLTARYTDHGEACILVHPAARYEQSSATEFRIDPLDPDHYQRLLEAIGPLTTVVHLWSLDLTENEGGDACTSALFLCQALISRAASPPSVCWLVTRGAQSLAGDHGPLAPCQAPLWGFGLVMDREHPELHSRLLDLDPAQGPEAADDLFRALSGEDLPDEENRSAFRAGRRYVPRLARLASAPATLILQPEASYLITGGFGGMGLLMASWLVQHGARHLFLIGRTLPSSEAERTIAALSENGAAISVLRTDISNFEEVTDLLTLIRNSHPPLHGVIHCAGNFNDALIKNQQRAQFRTVFSAKAQGAWNLHLATQGAELDFFLLCSSAFSLLPSPGLANYAAANAFLDTLAAERRRQGLAGLSINWGPWNQVGMARAVGERRETQWATAGIARLEASDALTAMEQLLGTDLGQAAILEVNWGRFGGHEEGLLPFISELLRRDPEDAPAAPILAQLRSATLTQRNALLLDLIAARTAAVLGFAHGEELDIRRGLFDLGMDSLTAMELRNTLQRDLRIGLPATVIMEHPNVAALSNYLATKIQEEPIALPNTTPYSKGKIAGIQPPPEPEAGQTMEQAVAAELLALELLLNTR